MILVKNIEKIVERIIEEKDKKYFRAMLNIIATISLAIIVGVSILVYFKWETNITEKECLGYSEYENWSTYYTADKACYVSKWGKTSILTKSDLKEYNLHKELNHLTDDDIIKN